MSLSQPTVSPDLEHAEFEGYRAGIREVLSGTPERCPFPDLASDLAAAWRQAWGAVVEVHSAGYVSGSSPTELQIIGLDAQIAVLQREQAQLGTASPREPGEARLEATLQALINALTGYRQAAQTVRRASARLAQARANLPDPLR